MRFLADENFPRPALEAFRKAGWDVVSITEECPGVRATRTTFMGCARGSAPQRVTRYPQRKEQQIMSLDWSQCPAVESIPGKVSGAWVLRGTRTPVKVLFENLEAGMSIEEVIEQFPVTREQLDSLMAFVARSLEKAPSYG
jgi:uncharacterized protein (DUF433 family)